MSYKTKILFTEFVTHDVKNFVVEKPNGFEFSPGQATEISIDLDDWRNKKRPFTFTSLNNDLVLQFTIKGYPEHNGVTEKLHQLKPGEDLLIENPWGTITFQGKGVYLAGGAGVTPFIAIFRNLRKRNKLEGNKLIFSNKTKKDIILEKEFKQMLGDNLLLTLTRQEKKPYLHGRIDKKFLSKHINDFSQNFYVCGPPPFVKSIKTALKELGADMQEIVFEGK